MIDNNLKEQEQLVSTSENNTYMQTLDDAKITDLLKKLLIESVKKFYKKDSILINKSMEQASVARIFYYMQDAINNDKRFQIFKSNNYHDSSNYESDYNKLKDFTSTNGTYCYKLGVFVKLSFGKVSYTYFINGKKIPKQAIFAPNNFL